MGGQVRKRPPEPSFEGPHTAGRGAFVKHGARWGVSLGFDQEVNINRVEQRENKSDKDCSRE